MKKIFCLLLLVTMILSLCACGNSNKNEYDPSKGNVIISEDMLEDIRSTVLDEWDNNKLSFSFESDALRAANARIGVSSGYEDIKEFTSIKITSEDYYDDYHYGFYGKIYGRDKYNTSVEYNFRLTILCAEDSTSESGYKIKRDGISIDIK